MKHILKNLNIGGLLALVAGVVLMVSWKAVESNKAVAQWYEVTIIDQDQPHDEPSNLAIGSVLNNGPSGSCSLSSGDMCAIPIDKKEYTGTINTLEQAQNLADDEDIDLGTPVFRTPQS